mmetsp:Transcript_17303/g.47934  ORF Transcript_17303/g.47934 Transcript_17303/m.47934 type:complete len:315 (-) Transcript_17303:1274-2218(-)
MSGRKAVGRGQMTRGANSGPAIMLMPPHIRETFVPNPPLKSIAPVQPKRKHKWSGMFQYLKHFEKTEPPKRKIQPTPHVTKQMKLKQKEEDLQNEVKPKVEEYRKEQKEFGGEYRGMNCYNTLFVGRLAYEVTERKLLREMETFGHVKDLELVMDKEGKSKGYAFVEYENEDDMKRAYRAADGMKIEGRAIVVDVERGHTVPTWLPRRLGGGLGGTRLGGNDKNVTLPGRFNPSRPGPADGGPPGGMMDSHHGGMGRGGGGPPSGYGGFGSGPGGYGPSGGGGRGDGGGRKRFHRDRDRSPSPGRGRYAPRARY